MAAKSAVCYVHSQPKMVYNYKSTTPKQNAIYLTNSGLFCVCVCFTIAFTSNKSAKILWFTIQRILRVFCVCYTQGCGSFHYSLFWGRLYGLFKLFLNFLKSLKFPRTRTNPSKNKQIRPVPDPQPYLYSLHQHVFNSLCYVRTYKCEYCIFFFFLFSIFW